MENSMEIFLGLFWNTKEDELFKPQFKVNELQLLTKREILKIIMSILDSLGILAQRRKSQNIITIYLDE